MKISKCNNNLILSEVRDFDLREIFECGQCFRWEKDNDGSYTGIAFSHPLKIEQKGDSVILYDTSEADFKNIWYNYFDFDTDYGNIKKTLSSDAVLRDAIGFGGGIRILNQELWECAVSFIISASNNIPRIKKIITSLCNNFGDKKEYLGNIFYTFPSPERIAALSLEELAVIKAGFRDKYILACAKAFTSGYSAGHFKGLMYHDAKRELMKIPGIGNKVADCILLFSLSYRQSFPVDVWVKRVMEYFYFSKEVPIDEIRRFSEEKFSDLGGYAQQYLFFYARENKIGV